MIRTGLVLVALLAVGSSLAHAEVGSPADYYGTYVEARELFDRKEFEKARPLLQQLSERFPLDGENALRYAITLDALGRSDEAIAAAEKAVETGAGVRRHTSHAIAKAYARTGRSEQALDWLERAIADRYTPRTRLQQEPEFRDYAQNERFRRIAGLLPSREFSRGEGWRYDIDFLVAEAKRLHASFEREAFSNEFERAARELSDAVPGLTDTQIRVRMQALITLLHDGHSEIDLDQDALRLPVRLYFFKDGVFVIDAADEHERWIGSRVVKIGSRTVEQLLVELPKYVPRDNDMGVLWRGPHILAGMNVLQVLGAADSSDVAVLTLQQGREKPRQVKVHAVPSADQGLRGLGAVPSTATSPLYLRNVSTAYWFTRVAPATTYFQYNGVWQMQEQSIEEFARALHENLRDGAAQNLIIDMRHNSGGDLGTYPPLLRTIAAFRASSAQHRVFCIIGRNTFSAAQAFITDLERFVDPVFVGEPSGSSPNFVGESSGWFELPYSRTRASISERHHQHAALPDDARHWIAPRIPVDLASADYFANRDPALDAVLAVIGEPSRQVEEP